MVTHIALLLSITSALRVTRFVNEMNSLLPGANLKPKHILDASTNGYVAISDVPFSVSSDTEKAWYDAMDQGKFQEVFSSHFGNDVTALFSSDIAKLISTSENLSVCNKSVDTSKIENKRGDGAYYAFAQESTACSKSAVNGLRGFAGNCVNLPISDALSVSYLNEDNSKQHVSMYLSRDCQQRAIHTWVDPDKARCFRFPVPLLSIWTDSPGSNAPNR